MIETLKGGKYEKGNLTKTVDMKQVTFPKQGSASVIWMKQKWNRKVLVLSETPANFYLHAYGVIPGIYNFDAQFTTLSLASDIFLQFLITVELWFLYILFFVAAIKL